MIFRLKRARRLMIILLIILLSTWVGLHIQFNAPYLGPFTATYELELERVQAWNFAIAPFDQRIADEWASGRFSGQEQSLKQVLQRIGVYDQVHEKVVQILLPGGDPSIDSWGNPYQVSVPPNEAVQVYSLGADGQSRTLGYDPDDILEARQAEVSTFYLAEINADLHRNVAWSPLKQTLAVLTLILIAILSLCLILNSRLNHD